MPINKIYVTPIGQQRLVRILDDHGREVANIATDAETADKLPAVMHAVLHYCGRTLDDPVVGDGGLLIEDLRFMEIDAVSLLLGMVLGAVIACIAIAVPAVF